MLFLFWFLIVLIVYLYIGYPLILWILSSFKHKEQDIDQEFEPTVTFIITAYNEEKVIEEKIKNTLTLDYPRQKMEIIVVSDGSTDRTEEIVQRYTENRVRLISTGRRIGKTECQNSAVKESKGEILIFSDANSLYEEDAVKMLIRNFITSKVGCVGGRLNYAAKGGAAQSESLYLKYESTIKSLESDVCSTIGVDGGIYAIRKDVFIPLEKDIISDFVEPVLIYKRGWKVGYEKEARITEVLSESMQLSIKRRVRIVTRALNGLLHVKDMLNPFRWRFFSLELISHKLLRWLQPLLFIALFISNIFLIDKLPFLIFFSLQVILYISGVLGLIFEKTKLFKLPSYFLGMNCALILSWINFIKRKNFMVWEPLR